MKPVETESTNAVFKLPGGTDMNDLPLTRMPSDQGDCLVSVWELTDDERRVIAEGSRIELIVWGGAHPPVALRTEVEAG
jgi:hypothetical protein